MHVQTSAFKAYDIRGIVGAGIDEIFAEHQAGKLNFAIGKTYALELAKEAHTDLAARKTTGKLLLVSN